MTALIILHPSMKVYSSMGNIKKKKGTSFLIGMDKFKLKHVKKVRKLFMLTFLKEQTSKSVAVV